MSSRIRHFCEAIFAGSRLTRAEAEEALLTLTTEEVPAPLTAAFLSALRMRSPTVHELLGFRDALVQKMRRVPLNGSTAGLPVIDLCGTGGDNKDTFNISTTAAFVVAASGLAKVAKHGNYGFSSRCGSSNVIEALGIPLSAEADKIAAQIERHGLAFLHAPTFHPALKTIAPVRRELGFRTVLNLLGPLLNPAEPTHQVIGVPTLEIARLHTAVCRELPIEFSVVHTLDGYDEVSLTDTTRVFSRKGERDLQADTFMFGQITCQDLLGAADVAGNAKILERILRGEGTPAQTAAVVANSAVALHTLGTITLSEAIKISNEVVRSKRAYELLSAIRTEAK